MTQSSPVEAQVAQVQAQAKLAAARTRAAEVARDKAKLNRSYATVVAPRDGTISKLGVRAGQTVGAGQTLLMLVPNETYVTANFKETQLAAMKVGQKVTIDVDAYGGKDFVGHVDSIAAATGARFSLLPPENATGNYVKVVQRVPVKIVLETGQDPNRLLRPGMSVVPTVHTR